ncbi:addiction module antidote protein [Fibrobacter sp. UBA4309]|uniref:addiction module antidote protein n=1 Tax=Fibrobacter sp. UBA4309 TaxID=1946537 RepID=UPI0025C36930|nr:addiction module antidote protein [Fibrobacter sp. UBA4309]
MRKDDAEISDYDVADYLKTEIEVRYFLEEILNANDPKLLQMALGDVARSAGMAKIAKKAGLNRESLYKALKEEAHPRFETVMRVFNAMGMKLSLTPYVAEKPAKYSTKKEPKTKKGDVFIPSSSRASRRTSSSRGRQCRKAKSVPRGSGRP